MAMSSNPFDSVALLLGPSHSSSVVTTHQHIRVQGDALYYFQPYLDCMDLSNIIILAFKGFAMFYLPFITFDVHMQTSLAFFDAGVCVQCYIEFSWWFQDIHSNIFITLSMSLPDSLASLGIPC